MHGSHLASAAQTQMKQGAHMQAEDGGGGRLGGIQLSAVDGIDDGARVAQLDARTHTIAPTCPPARSHALTQSAPAAILIPQTL